MAHQAQMMPAQAAQPQFKRSTFPTFVVSASLIVLSIISLIINVVLVLPL